jgi:hypothetical protein
MNVVYGILLATLMIGVQVFVVANASLSFAASAAFIIAFPLLMSLVSAVIINRIVNKTMLQLAA